MMLLRAAVKEDLDAIYNLALQSGIGITTLSKDRLVLERRLSKVARSCAKIHIPPIGDEQYLFVLEEMESKRIVGVSGIDAYTGFDNPFYSYKILKESRVSHDLRIHSDYEILNLVNDNEGCTEICSLFLLPPYRDKGNGLLLSKGRFMFMGQFKDRFSSKVIAEIRGVTNKHGYSPFWNALGKHFFHLSFQKADALTLSTNKQFIADLMPRNPIYIPLLPKAAQKVIGLPHPTTVPAMKILENEGFSYNHYVDIFDAGPTLEVSLGDIATIRQSQLLTIKNCIDKVESMPYLISNTSLQFRATIAAATFNVSQKSCILSKNTASILQLQVGDTVRVVPLHLTGKD